MFLHFFVNDTYNDDLPIYIYQLILCKLNEGFFCAFCANSCEFYEAIDFLKNKIIVI